ncbi:tRNA lysidine(34) synthetase TilS [Buchnera aphidicola]|uniref:tRNA(Ile)-lysidine synthase n=1 Tax=Buchnera aphidicola subsp. Cinara cedri (strain Cc) TaxID=372461 RepID=Q057Z8_BUCCC|nr:tRNA lysidine(34) synthetase TilS [Buchnera aphidicola]ABJ90551.1 tRNA(Ile)-lysidine synthetase [Buchnera aphidicola BCc]
MFIKKLFKKYPTKKKFLLALSGGVDSTVLFYQLIIWKKKFQEINFRTIHINHHLHSHAKLAQKHCINICKKNKIEIKIFDIIIPKKNKYGIEGYSRLERLKIFKKNILPEEILLTGHNMNDLCENIFLSLKRKSGINGISGMNFYSKYDNIKIIRPLINIKKENILFWAKKKKIKWIEDQSNKNNQYDRNFIRNKILSKIYLKWPYFLKNSIKSINLLKKDKKILNYFLSKFLKKNIYLDKTLSLINFDNLILEAKFSILKMWLYNNSQIIPTYYIIKRIYNELIDNENYFNKKILFQKKEIRRYKKNIYYINPEKKEKKIVLYWKNIFQKIKLPNKLGYLIAHIKKKKKTKKNISYIPFPKKNTLITVCFHIKKKKTKIKKIWQKYNIPPWLRNNIPLLFYNKKLISCIGIFIEKEKKKEKKKYISIKWINKIN